MWAREQDAYMQMLGPLGLFALLCVMTCLPFTSWRPVSWVVLCTNLFVFVSVNVGTWIPLFGSIHDYSIKCFER
jgi:hypothetical protein